MLELPGFASDTHQGPGRTSPESGDILAGPDFVSNFDPGPREPLLQSGISLNMPNFAGVVDVSQVQNFVSVSDPGAWKDLPGVREYVGNVRFRQ